MNAKRKTLYCLTAYEGDETDRLDAKPTIRLDLPSESQQLKTGDGRPRLTVYESIESALLANRTLVTHLLPMEEWEGSPLLDDEPEARHVLFDHGKREAHLFWVREVTAEPGEYAGPGDAAANGWAQDPRGAEEHWLLTEKKAAASYYVAVESAEVHDGRITFCWARIEEKDLGRVQSKDTLFRHGQEPPFVYVPMEPPQPLDISDDELPF